MQELIRADLSALLPSVRDAVISPRTKRAYYAALREFIEFNGGGELGHTSVLAFRQHLVDRGLASASVNLALSAVRKLADEAERQGLISERTWRQIKGVQGMRSRGVSTGNWLTEEQALALLTAPDQSTAAGRRDFVLLGLLIGCGMRREEAINVRCEQAVERCGRLVLLDVEGKGRKIRTLAVPKWLDQPLRDWMAEIRDRGTIVRRIWRGGEIADDGVTGEAVRQIVGRYCQQLGIKAAPHDLRRTFALQALDGGATVESVRQALGHTSLATTTRYVASVDALRNPACDFMFGGAK